MNHKKSMRIFWLSLSLLLISGVIIIAAVQIRTHKKAGGEQDDTARQTTTAAEGSQPFAGSASIPSVTGNQTPEETGGMQDQSLQQTNGGAAAYMYEIRIRNGYLEVYYYHTKRLFLYTGIPYQMLTTKQRLDLQRGKYFKDEQELYGYLESCTS